MVCWNQRGVFSIGSPVHGRVGLTLRQHRLNQPNGMMEGILVTGKEVSGEERRWGGLFRGGYCDNFQPGTGQTKSHKRRMDRG